MKIIVRGILQKLLKYWTIRRRDDRPSKPATQRNILEIDWFYFSQLGSSVLLIYCLPWYENIHYFNYNWILLHSSLHYASLSTYVIPYICQVFNCLGDQD